MYYVYCIVSSLTWKLADEVKEWYEKLERINLTIGTWQKVEKQWLDYQPIFTCDNIRSHLHTEVILFQVCAQFTQPLVLKRSIDSFNLKFNQESRTKVLTKKPSFHKKYALSSFVNFFNWKRHTYIAKVLSNLSKLCNQEWKLLMKGT